MICWDVEFWSFYGLRKSICASFAHVFLLAIPVLYMCVRYYYGYDYTFVYIAEREREGIREVIEVVNK